MESAVLPCYVVCDVSLSMTDHLADLNAGLREFRGAVHADAAVADRVLCSVLGFAETPQLVQRLYPVDELADLPEPRGAGTNFGPVFTLLREVIREDLELLTQHRLRVHRPMVFFLTDGRPTDPVTWPAAFAALTDPSWPGRPHVVAYGIGDVDQEALKLIGTYRTYLGRDGVRMSTALIASVVSVLPRPGDGVHEMHDPSTSGPPAARRLPGKETPWRSTRETGR